LCLVFSCGFNIVGRIQLGRNWANHIRIYEAHTFVARGVYRVVRHPLYASIIWMFLAAGLVYCNWAALLATGLVFIPMMIFRAKQEERLLTRQFKEYRDYREKTGMFFPKILSRKSILKGDA
ncbi:MAG: isoprenylcysteine carboxylmethyltransferase family protein, partial [bacterium]|nr:isoprenylcysteine carboxylmethyltransferase family protein [bacterium]